MDKNRINQITKNQKIAILSFCTIAVLTACALGFNAIIQNNNNAFAQEENKVPVVSNGSNENSAVVNEDNFSWTFDVVDSYDKQLTLSDIKIDGEYSNFVNNGPNELEMYIQKVDNAKAKLHYRKVGGSEDRTLEVATWRLIDQKSYVLATTNLKIGSSEIAISWENWTKYSISEGSLAELVWYYNNAPQTAIRFDKNGGEWTQDYPGDVVAIKGQMMPTIPDDKKANYIPHKAQYTFNGYWDSTESNGGTQYYDKDMNPLVKWDSAEDTHTLYAQWEYAGWSIDFEKVQGGSVRIVGEPPYKESDLIIIEVQPEEGYKYNINDWIVEPKGSIEFTKYTPAEENYWYFIMPDCNVHIKPIFYAESAQLICEDENGMKIGEDLVHLDGNTQIDLSSYPKYKINDVLNTENFGGLSYYADGKDEESGIVTPVINDSNYIFVGWFYKDSDGSETPLSTGNSTYEFDNKYSKIYAKFSKSNKSIQIISSNTEKSEIVALVDEETTVKTDGKLYYVNNVAYRTQFAYFKNHDLGQGLLLFYGQYCTNPTASEEEKNWKDLWIAYFVVNIYDAKDYTFSNYMSQTDTEKPSWETLLPETMYCIGNNDNNLVIKANVDKIVEASYVEQADYYTIEQKPADIDLANYFAGGFLLRDISDGNEYKLAIRDKYHEDIPESEFSNEEIPSGVVVLTAIPKNTNRNLVFDGWLAGGHGEYVPADNDIEIDGSTNISAVFHDEDIDQTTLTIKLDDTGKQNGASILAYTPKSTVEITDSYIIDEGLTQGSFLYTNSNKCFLTFDIQQGDATINPQYNESSIVFDGWTVNGEKVSDNINFPSYLNLGDNELIANFATIEPPQPEPVNPTGEDVNNESINGGGSAQTGDQVQFAMLGLVTMFGVLSSVVLLKRKEQM